MYTSIVEHDIELSELCDSVVHGVANVVLVSDITVDEGCSSRAELIADRLPELVLDVSDDHLGPVPAEEPGCALADAAGASRDDGHLAFQPMLLN